MSPHPAPLIRVFKLPKACVDGVGGASRRRTWQAANLRPRAITASEDVCNHWPAPPPAAGAATSGRLLMPPVVL